MESLKEEGHSDESVTREPETEVKNQEKVEDNSQCGNLLHKLQNLNIHNGNMENFRSSNDCHTHSDNQNDSGQNANPSSTNDEMQAALCSSQSQQINQNFDTERKGDDRAVGGEKQTEEALKDNEKHSLELCGITGDQQTADHCDAPNVEKLTQDGPVEQDNTLPLEEKDVPNEVESSHNIPQLANTCMESQMQRIHDNIETIRNRQRAMRDELKELYDKFDVLMQECVEIDQQVHSLKETRG